MASAAEGLEAPLEGGGEGASVSWGTGSKPRNPGAPGRGGLR